MKYILILRSLGELIRYDLVYGLFGFRRIHAGLAAMTPRTPTIAASADQLCEAVDLAAVLYWKRVRCLQRSVAKVRLLRYHGHDAKLVIAYRATPFVSHAWVEIRGKVVSESAGYKARLRILETI